MQLWVTYKSYNKKIHLKPKVFNTMINIVVLYTAPKTNSDKIRWWVIINSDIYSLMNPEIRLIKKQY